jgi:hypothetical protein
MTFKRIGTIVLALAAFGAMTALAPVTASASLPMFSHWPLPFTLTSGPGTLETSTGERIICSSDLGHGNITGLQSFLALILFHGCAAHSSEGSECPIHSPGQPGGLIHIHIVGELGTIKAGNGAGNIGAILEPALGGAFVTLIASCLEIEESAVEGSIAAELTPVNSNQSTEKLIVSGSNGKSGITEIAVLHKVIKPKILSFGLIEASESTTEENAFDGPVEVGANGSGGKTTKETAKEAPSSPMFNPAGPLALTLTSGASTLEAISGERIVCPSDGGAGSITGLQTLLALIIFHGCIAHSGSNECVVHSQGEAEGLIHVHLEGELGTIKTGSLVGALLKPALGKSEFATIQGSCLVTAAIKGAVAAEVTPVGTAQTTGKLVLSGSAGTPGIKEITVLERLEKPELTGFGGALALSISSTERNTFDGPVEVSGTPPTFPAVLPMFNPAGPLALTLASGTNTLEASSGERIVCPSDVGAGSITGLQTFLALLIFHGCIAHSGGSECVARGEGQPEGLIHIYLEGELGTIKTGSGVGALLKPALGKSELATVGGSCLATADITGDVAAELTPIGDSQTTGKFVLTGAAGAQSLTEIAVLGKLEKPELNGFAGSAKLSESSTETATYDGPVEVT